MQHSKFATIELNGAMTGFVLTQVYQMSRIYREGNEKMRMTN